MAPVTQNKQLEAAEVVCQALADDQKCASEKRRDDREPLVIPAQIYQAKFDLTLSGFVRNISTGGVCLIVPQPYREGTEATISLFGETSKVESTGTCCWNAKFGTTYWLSGWRLSKQLPVGRMLKEDHLVEPEQRTKNRVTTAIPVYIELPNSTTRVAGFTRNLSSDGISLVSKIETTPGQLASLEVMRANGEASPVDSRCLWAKRYGDDHWISGLGL